MSLHLPVISDDELLDNIGVATPCDADWAAMKGDERVRHCGDCRLNVYNLSAMTRQEAEDLLRVKEGGLCIGYYRRADGMMLTQDCPRGLAALADKSKHGISSLARFVILMCCLFISLLMILGGRGGGGDSMWEMEPFRTVES